MHHQHVRRWLSSFFTLSTLLLACGDEGGARPEQTVPGLAPEAAPPPPEPSPNEPPPSNLPSSCLLAGMEAIEREGKFVVVAYDYLVALPIDCWRRLLGMEWTYDQHADWGNYLLNYTSAVFGCGLVFEPLPGGVDAFGLANTDAVGVPGPTLSPADVTLLIDSYIAICATQLAVAPAALQPIRAHLERAAESRIDLSAPTRLADCPFSMSEGPPAQ